MNTGKSDITESTSQSLIRRAKQNAPEAWRRISRLYVPMVYRWARQAGLQESDAADVVQEVFRAISIHITEFQKNQPNDSFRGWLYTITRNKVRDHFRSLAARPDAPGGAEAYERLSELPEESTAEEISHQTAEVAHRALELMVVDFDAKTWQAFWRAVVDCQSPTEIAQTLKMSRASVYQAKSRVLRRLRIELKGLLDD